MNAFHHECEPKRMLNCGSHGGFTLGYEAKKVWTQRANIVGLSAKYK